MQGHESERNLPGLLWVAQPPVGGSGQQAGRRQRAPERCFAEERGARS